MVLMALLHWSWQGFHSNMLPFLGRGPSRTASISNLDYTWGPGGASTPAKLAMTGPATTTARGAAATATAAGPLTTAAGTFATMGGRPLSTSTWFTCLAAAPAPSSTRLRHNCPVYNLFYCNQMMEWMPSSATNHKKYIIFK